MSRAWRRGALGIACALAALALLLAAARLHDGPIGPLPGGALRAGALAGAPSDWSEFSAAQTIEIETRPGAPWSVTTWLVVHERRLYVSADFLNPRKRWPFFALDDPRVVVRLRDGSGVLRRFAGHAERIEDAPTIAALRGAFARKYQLDANGLAARTEIWFFRIAEPAAGAPGP